MTTAIAIVGMACHYPDASTPLALWQNVLSKRKAFRNIPRERLNLDDYRQDNSPDSIYLKQAALLQDYQFDRVKFRISGETFRSADMAHWLALDVAAQALSDAGFPEGEGLNRDTTGVLLGNTLTGEFSRAESLRLRWPYVQRQLNSQLINQSMNDEQRLLLLSQFEQLFKTPFIQPNEETLAGGLSNTIAGRICNYFNLGGGGYCLDGACSSSLLAVANACSQLISGDLNVAIAGGVDLSLDPFELVGFSRTGAFAHDEMRVYDKQGTGFLPGEGCGFLVLMRHDDAIAQGLRSYAVIRGWGISSDGSGGITRPESHGQRLAIRRAYQRAGYSISTVPFFEGHGTGTAIGDSVELKSLNEERLAARADDQAIISSVKANIGHTKAAAGVAGLIKATMALHTQVLPPATNIKSLHPELKRIDSKLKTSETSKIWPKEKALRAGVSSFGFGGINVHIALESLSNERRKSFTTSDNSYNNSSQDCELLLFSVNNHQQLSEQLQLLEERTHNMSQSEMTDCACYFAKNLDTSCPLRAAIVATTLTQLSERLSVFNKLLQKNPTRIIDINNGIFLNEIKKQSNIVFLFPGQASPVRKTSGAMGERFEFIKQHYKNVEFPITDDTKSTALAQPAIIAAELAGLKLLEKIGIRASNVLGHSLGEIASLYWSGALNEEMALDFATKRGEIMSQQASDSGAMASIGANAQTVHSLINNNNSVYVACYNSPKQTIISGEKSQIEEVCNQAAKLSIESTILPVSRSFHSPSMSKAANEFSKYLNSQEIFNAGNSFVSSVTGNPVIEEQNLKKLLKEQFTSPVKFSDAIAQLSEETDLFLEIGPGKIISGLIGQQTTIPCLPLDVGSDTLLDLFMAIGACHVLGTNIDGDFLFQQRFHRNFDLQNPPIFLTNPCETAAQLSSKFETVDLPVSTEQIDDFSHSANVDSKQELTSQDSIQDQFIALIANRLELPEESISAENRLLMDLHLNSISVSQMVTDLARNLDLPAPAAATDYSNATIQEVAQAMEELKTTGINAVSETKEKHPQGINAWVRAFTITHQHQALSAITTSTQNYNSQWQLYKSINTNFCKSLLNELQSKINENGVVIVVSENLQNTVNLLLKASRQVIANQNECSHFVLIQSEPEVASFARTFFQELTSTKVTIFTGALSEKNIPHIISEIANNKGFSEVSYEHSSKRQVPILNYFPITDNNNKIALTPQDVVLISGGGKGIAAECALQLALKTGASIALLGRSRQEEDQELSNNLQRFASHGCNFSYYSVDVTNQAEIKSTIQLVNEKLGTITAIIHGAGVNHPCIISQLTEEMFQQTLHTKIDGAYNLLSAINASKLKYFIAFSSIIGRTGMRGEADYAVANEQLSLLTAKLKQDYPSCRCLSIEWSVWSGVGMGERLGRIDALLDQGITPISTDQGVAIFLQLMKLNIAQTSLVISGRLGEIETLSLVKPELPFQRFLEQTRVFYPGVELIAEAELSLDADPYLKDHQLAGDYIFPAVMGMEAMAQVASALFNSHDAEAELINFTELKFLHPIVIPDEESLIIRTAALLTSTNTVEVVIRCSRTGFMQDHFKAKCCFGSKMPGIVRAYGLKNNIKMNMYDDLYDNLLFHQGKFRRINSYQLLHTLACQVEIAADENDNWFSRYLPQNKSLADPGARDAVIHAIQACIPHARLLPVSIEKLEIFSTEATKNWRLFAKQQWRRNDLFCYDLEVYNNKGVLLERWSGLTLHKVENLKVKSWIEPLLVPYLERRISELIPGTNIQISVLNKNNLTRRERSVMAISEASLSEQNEIIHRPDGKPEIANENQYVSASHQAHLTLAVSSEQIVACDVEQVFNKTVDQHQHVINEDLQILAAMLSESAQENYEISATRIWTALECLKKAGQQIKTPIILSECHKDGWVLLNAGDNTIATYLTQLSDSDIPVIIAILVGSCNADI